MTSSNNGQCSGRYVEPATTNRSDNQTSGTGSINASAKSLTHVEDHSTTLNGEVDLQRDNMRLKADFATIDANSQSYTAEGAVELRQPGLLVRGTEVRGNLLNDDAVIDSASFLMHQSRLRGNAATLSHTEQGQLTILDGNFTTCEPESNAWVLNGDEITLKPDQGYGEARDVTLRVSNVPIAYLPYLRFPINETRQSGFLVPSIGHDSDGGTDIALPYYFNIAPNLDATYTPRSIWKRGLLHEAETRYLTPSTSNLLAGTFLPSDDAYESRSLNPATAESQPDRWLVHLRHKGTYGRWSSNINFTRVSDIDYLDDLGGFTNTDANFDRALNQSNDPALLRTGALAYRGKVWTTKLSLRSFQNLNQLQPRQYEMLPRLEISAKKRWGGIQTALLMQATEFDNKQDIVTGNRFVMDASVSVPIERSWGFIRPGARVIQRHYSLDNAATGNRDDANITTGMVSLDAGLVFERNSTWFGTATRQTLEPRFHYLYVGDDFQNDLPSFDSILLTPGYQSLFRENRFTGYDRLGDENRIALGFTSRHFAQKTGAELIAFSLGQIYHQSDRDVTLATINPDNNLDDSSPLYAELTLSTEQFRFYSSYEHNTESGGSNRGYVSLAYRPASNKLFNIGFSMTDTLEQRPGTERGEEESDLSFYWPIGNSGRWQFLGRWNYSWDNAQTIESLLGVEYNACCWRSRILFRRNLEEPRAFVETLPGQPATVRFDRRADSGVFFEFQLKGLASLGGRLNTLIRQSIPNYTDN